MLIEGNHIHNGHYYDWDDPYFPVTIITDGSDTYSGDPAFIDEEIISQGSVTGRLKGMAEVDGHTVLYVAETDGYSTGVELTGDTSGATMTPTKVAKGYHGGSAISVRALNVTIRNNIIHDFKVGQGIKFYGEGFGYTGMVVENNLIYDHVKGGSFAYIGGSFILRNNTFIGYLGNDGLGTGDLPQRYVSPAGVRFFEGYDGTGSEFYNNIFVGGFSFPDPDDPTVNKYNADNNIFWSRSNATGSWVNSGKGNNSFIAVWKTYDPDVFHGYPNFFEYVGFNGTTDEYDYATDGIQPFFVNPGYRTNRYKPGELDRDAGKSWDYHLADGSPGINFGNPNNQPPNSLGTIGPDGFIRNDGQPRDASHHSVGCYEYVPADSNNQAPVFDPINDVNVNVNETLTFEVRATDADGDTITYSIQNKPPDANFSNRTFSWTPSSSHPETRFYPPGTG